MDIPKRVYNIIMKIYVFVYVFVFNIYIYIYSARALEMKVIEIRFESDLNPIQITFIIKSLIFATFAGLLLAVSQGLRIILVTNFWLYDAIISCFYKYKITARKHFIKVHNNPPLT